MCDAGTIHELENGGGESLRVQSKALAQIMRALNDIPKRDEVRSMIETSLAVHSNACSASRSVEVVAQSAAKPPEKNSLKLAVGKWMGFEAQGKAGVILSAIFWAILGGVIMFVVMHANEASSLIPKGATP